MPRSRLALNRQLGFHCCIQNGTHQKKIPKAPNPFKHNKCKLTTHHASRWKVQVETKPTSCIKLLVPSAPLVSILVDLFSTLAYCVQTSNVTHLSIRSVRNTMGIRGPRNDTWDLWHHWWKGPNDLSVGEGPGRWEHLPPPKSRSHKGKAISYK